MANVIAVIKLAPGEVGYYDELTRIHLTIGRPKAEVLDFMNTSRLRRSVMSKTLVLVAGSLNPTNYSMDSEVSTSNSRIIETSVAIETPVVEVITTVEKIEQIVEETIIPEVKNTSKANDKKKKKEA